MAEKTNVPEIRFAGFTDPWEQRKLAEISESYSGGTPSAGKDEYYGGDIPFIRSAEIADFKTELFLTEEGYKSSSAQMVKPGDILYALYGATSGEVAVSKQKGAINQAILAILPTEKCDASYLASWLRSMKQTIVATYLQGGQGNLSGAIVKELEVPLPCIAEQKHIGFLFANLDNLITLHQRKYDKLCAVKKSMLDKMFPKPGEIEPEIRFAGFTDPWEQRKLGDVATRHDNLRIPITAKDRIPGDTPYYGANGIQDYVEGYTHEGEFVLVAEDGATDLGNYPVQLISGLSWVNNHAHVIKAIPDLAQNRFIMHLIKSMDIASYLVGGTRSKLNAEVLMGIELKLPSNSEQIYIGTLLSTLDSLITLHQRELNLLKNTKKSLLDKMFV